MSAKEQDTILPDLKRKITIFSSCRLDALVRESYIHYIHHTHNSKEVIQYIKYINGDIDIDREMYKYVFRSCCMQNSIAINRNILKEEFFLSDIICIELCSRKKYTKNGYFIHHLAADKGDAPINNLIEENKSNDQYALAIQNKEEIEQDILEILDMLNNKNLILSRISIVELKKEKR